MKKPTCRGRFANFQVNPRVRIICSFDFKKYYGVVNDRDDHVNAILVETPMLISEFI